MGFFQSVPCICCATWHLVNVRSAVQWLNQSQIRVVELWFNLGQTFRSLQLFSGGFLHGSEVGRLRKLQSDVEPDGLQTHGIHWRQREAWLFQCSTERWHQVRYVCLDGPAGDALWRKHELRFGSPVASLWLFRLGFPNDLISKFTIGLRNHTYKTKNDCL